ncbi:MAG: phosphoglucosamine mutase [Acidimicrobiia bacterium]|nr:phosphoglucosamine mutase [Acidimicrobiia bacterium]
MTLRFGTDGVRGIANRELTPELVVALGRTAATVLGDGRPFVVARDTRRSGPMLEAALVAGLCSVGVPVLTGGVLPTPALAHLSGVHDAPGAMISASHNPFPDNGVKLFARGGRKLTDAEEAAIEARLGSGPGDDAPVGEGVGEPGPLPDAGAQYVEHVVGTLGGRRLDGLRVVVDCAHGAAFEVAPRALRLAGARVEVLHDRPDGTNINAGCGSTDPGPLRRAVREEGADAGLAFDGDADRVVAVDERGALVDGDQILAVAALDLQRRGLLRGGALAVTVMSNLGLRRALAEHGVRVVETPVGDRNVLAAIEAHGLSLGGEQSGHVVFADLATTGDGLLTGLQLLDVVVRSGQPLSELASVVQPLPQILRNVRVADRARLDDAPGFRAALVEVEAGLGEAGRVLVRASGTEPVIRVMVEAPTAGEAEAAAARLVAAVEEACGEG